MQRRPDLLQRYSDDLASTHRALGSDKQPRDEIEAHNSPLQVEPPIRDFATGYFAAGTLCKAGLRRRSSVPDEVPTRPPEVQWRRPSYSTPTLPVTWADTVREESPHTSSPSTSSPTLSLQRMRQDAASAKKMPDFFSHATYQTVVNSPTISYRFDNFARSARCNET